MIKLPDAVSQYFPYKEVRPHQDEFIRAIYDTVDKGHSTLIEGSNGLGKTVATLSACLPKAEKDKLKILYVARTHRQHDRVIEELKAISEKHSVSGISVRGRHEMCLNHIVTRYAMDARAIMEVCELLKARNRCPYYRNIEQKTEEYSDLQMAVTQVPYKASEIQNICRKRGFCPYELVKTCLSEVNVIALSYLYIFDPEIRMVFLKNLEKSLSKIILIIDEAHNLPETAVDIASSKLTLFAIKRAEDEARKFKHKDIAMFSRIIKNEIEKTVEKIGKEALVPPKFLLDVVQDKVGIEKPKAFFEQLYAAGNAIKRNLLREGQYPRSFIHSMGEFMLRWLSTAEDEAFIRVLKKYVSKRGFDTARLEIVALDPSRITEPVFSSTHSNIIVSGTLQPLDAYMKITKLPEDTTQNVVPSPFPKEHIHPLICYGVTTAMEQRTPEMYRKISMRIKEVVEHTPCSTGVFAASFEVLSALIGNGLKKTISKPLFCEHRNMTSKENEKMVAEYKAYSKAGGAVLLGVQGGRSSEGVDFPGDQMNSVVIVGIPYAQPTPRVKAQIDYFEKCFPGYGREYGYVLSAMKKASQAAGRPIRTLEDRGAMVFLDRRFASSYCQNFLPLWIRENLKILQDSDGVIARELDNFFRKAS